MKQWDIVLYSFENEQPHPVVILTPDERLARPVGAINGLMCVSLRAARPLREWEVMLNSADGLDWQTACRCDFVYALDRGSFREQRGRVSRTRQAAIARRVREFFRLNLS